MRKCTQAHISSHILWKGARSTPKFPTKLELYYKALRYTSLKGVFSSW